VFGAKPGRSGSVDPVLVFLVQLHAIPYIQSAMKFERSAGILLHPTSLPGKFGIGDMGTDAFRFVDFLEAAGQKLWQVLPLGPTGFGDSPYQTFSAFAGNPFIVSPEKLAEDGLLDREDCDRVPDSEPKCVDFGKVIGYKMGLLKKAFQNFKTRTVHERTVAFKNFCTVNKDWLEDYASFMALKDQHDGGHWAQWEPALVARKQAALHDAVRKHSDDIMFYKFVQFIFFKQWNELKSYANGKGIKVVGDLPIFVAYDSADVWANKDLFDIDKNGILLTKAGVPPDYFSPTGQLWGNPLYRWDAMSKGDFPWWQSRISKLLELVDIMRIDHFRGFDAYWEIPGDAPTAEKGRWVKTPGEKFFSTVKRHLGELPIIAEDLGLITKSVRALRDKFDFPGMKILQFAFGTNMERRFLPHNLEANCVVYTGSHDNDTTRGYFEKAKHDHNDIYVSAQRYLNYFGDDVRMELIRAAYASVANTVIIPMQDVLNLGTQARMNFPGKLGGNWTWRFTWEQISPPLAGEFKNLAELYDRPPKPQPPEISI